MTGLTAEYFDNWYADMRGSAVLEAAKRRHLGLPPELMSTSLLTFDGLHEVARLLALAPGQTLLDLACGRGGYGQWLARETGARVVGVDFSAVALGEARRAVAAFGLVGRADYHLGELEATGLAAASVDAVLCVDSVQFSSNAAGTAAEVVRVLRPGGRAVFTCWEPADPSDTALPERVRRLDLATQLPAGGLVDVELAERPEWLAAERSYWQEAVATDPGDDPALQSWHNEGVRSLEIGARLRRVLATGRAPL